MTEIIQRYLFNENGEVVGYEYRGRLVRCEDCFYYIPEVDDPHKSNCQRPWGGMTECNPDSYCSDGLPKNEVK